MPSESQRANLQMLADALGVKVKDEDAAVEAFSALVDSCGMSESEDAEEEPPSKPMGKGKGLMAILMKGK